MTYALLISALFSTVAAFAGESMSVAVCNVGKLPAQAVERAEVEAAYVFQSMNVGIRWTGCGAEVDAADVRLRPDFIVRMRMGGHLPKAGDTSLEAMGRAFMNEDGTGNMADVYYGAIQELANLFPIAGSEQLMGYTMAHELGHLLIGAGHRPNGLMRSALSKNELEALSHRRLKFNEAEQAAILHRLSSRRGAARLRISVMVFDQAEVSDHTLREAQERADAILNQAGVEVKWIDCHQSANASVCETVAQPDRLILTIVTEDNRRVFGEDVLGRSMPGDGSAHGVYARVFYGHILAKAEQERVNPAQLLGLAVAHEFGHLLLGPKAHSAEGIMRANWGRRDMAMGAKGQLRFNDQQAARIRDDVQSRTEERERPQN